MWEDFGHASIVIDQVDYEVLLADRGMSAPGGSHGPGSGSGPGGRKSNEPVAHDAIWETIVRSMSSGKAARGLSVQQRLLEIARSTDAVESLAGEAVAEQHGASQPGKIAAQAATVLTMFQRLVRAVEAQSPGEVPETLRHLAEAASRLDPQIVMRAIGESAESGVGADVTTAMGRWFDEDQVAHMLAKSLEAEGTAAGRMAAALNTLVPDAARQQRVMRLARTHWTPETGDDATGVDTAWRALETMLSGPGAAAANTAEYNTSLDDSEARSYQLSLTTPAQMDGWIHTVDSDSVRTLSVTLLLDLLTLEQRPDNIAETAGDLATLAADLLMSADSDQSEQVVRGLAAVSTGPSTRHAMAAQRALETLAGSNAMRETTATLADFDQAQMAWFERMCTALGPSSLNTLVSVLAVAADDEGRRRIEHVIALFGDVAIAPLMPLLDAPNWPAVRAAIYTLGQIGSPAAIKLLDSLIGGPDPRKAYEAVVALARIDDAAALRGVAAALRDGSPAVRMRVVDALAASHEPRTGPLLASALAEARVLGSGHHLAIRTLGALRQIGGDQAVPAIVRAMQAWSWFRIPRASRLKRAAAGVLASMNTTAALTALNEAARTGDVLLKRYARAATRRGSQA